MIGGVSGVGIGFCNPYTYGYNRAGQGLQAQMTQALQNTQRSGGIALVRSARRAASPETPVQPVRPAAPVSAFASAAISSVNSTTPSPALCRTGKIRSPAP